MAELKLCVGPCRQEKSREEFNSDKSRKDGLASKCRSCASDYNKKRYANNAERIKAQVKKYRINNPEKISDNKRRYYIENLPRMMLKSAKIRASQINIPCTITVDDIVIPEYCPVLGMALVPGGDGTHDNSPSLDKIDPDKGYVPGNVQVISKKANTMKSNATSKELWAFARWVMTNVQA
jgi:hypothetical protein